MLQGQFSSTTFIVSVPIIEIIICIKNHGRIKRGTGISDTFVNVHV